jgi:hypothetical protein
MCGLEPKLLLFLDVPDLALNCLWIQESQREAGRRSYRI